MVGALDHQFKGVAIITRRTIHAKVNPPSFEKCAKLVPIFPKSFVSLEQMIQICQKGGPKVCFLRKSKD